MEEISNLFTTKIKMWNIPLEILEIKEFDEIYQVILVGGNNGHHNWPEYLTNLAKLMQNIDCWLIKIDNDVLDDIHYIYLGIEK